MTRPFTRKAACCAETSPSLDRAGKACPPRSEGTASNARSRSIHRARPVGSAMSVCPSHHGVRFVQLADCRREIAPLVLVFREVARAAEGARRRVDVALHER